MGKPTGFLEYERKTSTAEAPLERIKHFHEFKTPLKLEEQEKQGARCMDCGVPFCQYGGMLAGMASGGVMVFVWKYLIAPMGGAWAIYELLPAFLVASIAIVVVSLLTPAPEKAIVDEFEAVRGK